MPNYITNKLIINGDKLSIDQIIGLNNNQENNFSFKNTVPQPENIDENFDWYTWNINNWGTKWDLSDASIVNNSNVNNSNVNNSNFNNSNTNIEIRFYTAWSCPYIWFEKTIAQFPNLQFKLSWIDEDYPNCGLLLSNNGIINKKNFDSDDESKEFIAQEFPEIYKFYEAFRNILNIENEINDCVKEFYPNVIIKINDYEKNEEGIDEPKRIKIEYFNDLIDQTNQTNQTNPTIEINTFDTLDKNLQKNIIQKVKQIILEHGYKTIIKKSELLITEKVF